MTHETSKKLTTKQIIVESIKLIFGVLALAAFYWFLIIFIPEHQKRGFSPNKWVYSNVNLDKALDSSQVKEGISHGIIEYTADTLTGKPVLHFKESIIRKE